jgi:hypothetical protein
LGRVVVVETVAGTYCVVLGMAVAVVVVVVEGGLLGDVGVVGVYMVY